MQEDRAVRGEPTARLAVPDPIPPVSPTRSMALLHHGHHTPTDMFGSVVRLEPECMSFGAIARALACLRTDSRRHLPAVVKTRSHG